MISTLSYRYRIPLALCLISLLTTAVLLAVFAVSAYRSLHEHLTNLAQDVGSALAPSLAHPLQHDDLWRAYDILATTESPLSPLLIVLDSNDRVFASNRPRALPVLRSLTELEPAFTALASWIETPENNIRAHTDSALERVFVATPIVQNDEAIGRLLVGYPLRWLHERFEALAWRALWAALAVTLSIMLLGWFWARRIVQPLTAITDAMERLNEDELDSKNLPDGNDEVGRLGRTFRKLAADLKLKRQLEQQMITSERMAAVGRLTAGIAHEINNPLGGMFNALDTYRRHGQRYELTGKTLDLIERGLGQIRTIVSALLLDVKREDHALSRQDLNDVQTLLGADQRYQAVAVDWRFELDTVLPLPATRVRQILINLLLNALQAALPQGQVSCSVTLHDGVLQLRVDNTGKAIDAVTMQHLFEPFASQNGTGLGLWVTYQLVQQLNGTIQAVNLHNGARFTVTLPLPQQQARAA